MSDMDSDCDDVFAEDSKGFTADSKSGSENDGRHVMNRKRRRGIIEKRRRDRINNSLSELRRLVPAAFEKQGSAKLEKAEILQMTVDHLKLMTSKGINIFNFEPHNLLTDYHGVGFRECASEVARYLVTYEGLNLQDPLKLRLMSHLQCFTAQREALNSQPALQPPWFASLPAMPTPHYPQFSSRSSVSDLSGFSSSSRSDLSRYSSSSRSELSLFNSNRSERRQSSVSSMDSKTNHTGSPRIRTQLPISPIPIATSYYSSRQPPLVPDRSSQSSSLKPYRPWGTNLAY